MRRRGGHGSMGVDTCYEHDHREFFPFYRFTICSGCACKCKTRIYFIWSNNSFLPYNISLRLTLSCSSVTIGHHLMPHLVRSEFHAQLHLAGQYSDFKCLSFRFLPSSIISFLPTICVIFFCLKTLYCSLLRSMKNYPSNHIFSVQNCMVTES